jgi:hypothetical protein
MAVVRSKVFVAVKPFEVLGGGSYDTGDVVEGGDLLRVLPFGDTFVVDHARGPVVPEPEPEVEPEPVAEVAD